MRSVFIAGTDTGVGKTIAAGSLGYYLEKKGLRVITQKWVQTGSEGELSGDIKTHLTIMGKSGQDILKYREAVSPYVFRLAASPHLASRLSHRPINQQKIKKAFGELRQAFDCVIVEGAGGVLVPFDEKHLLIDIARDLKIPVLLVAENKLGAIHSTLAALEALRSRKMKVLGIVFNNARKCDKKILEDNPRIIKKIGKVRVLGVLPWQRSKAEARLCFAPIAKNIIKVLK